MCTWRKQVVLKVLETLPLDRRFAQVARKGRPSSLTSASTGQTVSSCPSVCLPELHPNTSFPSAPHRPGGGAGGEGRQRAVGTEMTLPSRYVTHILSGLVSAAWPGHR